MTRIRFVLLCLLLIAPAISAQPAASLTLDGAGAGRAFDGVGAASGGGGDLSQSAGSVNNAVDAYAIMGVEFGSSLADVTAAFRQKAKLLHPDANQGDRSSEPELRRMLEAYQFLKEYLSLSSTEPMRPPDGPFSPAE